jgi:hypothetical protein
MLPLRHRPGLERRWRARRWTALSTLLLGAVTAVEGIAQSRGNTAEASFSAEPTVQIGSLEGPEYMRFNQVRSARWLSGGEILISDGGSNEVRLFLDSGEHQWSRGGRGGGPGEFQGLAAALPYLADSIAGYDARAQRVTMFDASGGFGRTFDVRPPPELRGRASPVGRLPDGNWITTVNALQPISDEVARSTFEVWVYGPDGSPTRRLGVFPGRESARTEDGRTIGDLILPWGMQTLVAHRGDVTAVGDNGKGEVTVTRRGVSTVIHLDGGPEQFTDATFEAFVEARLGRMQRANARQTVTRMFNMVVLPETLPWYDRLLIDAEGRLWVRHFKVPGVGREDWTAFSPAGTAVMRMVPPEGFDVQDIRSDAVLGVWRDQLDVEHIRVYKLGR